MIWNRWDVHSMDGMVWNGFNDTERQYWVKNKSFMMFTPICSQSADLQQYLQPFTRHVFTIFSQSAFYKNFYTIHTDTLFPFFLLFFLLTIYTGVAGSTLLLRYNFFCSFLFFKSICQQRELPLLFDAGAVKCSSFLLFWEEGECNRGYLYCRSLNRGFKGWYGSRDDLYYWLPKGEV